MSVRLRKLIGTAIFVTFSIVYFFVTLTIALARLPDAGTAMQMLFYFVATLIWFLAGAGIIYWMQKGAPPMRTPKVPVE